MYKASLLLTMLATAATVVAQEGTSGGRLSPKEFAIPPTPVFDLMGVTTSQVNRTADIKDFKVDWSFKSWRLNPNLAIQSQPVWEIFYNRKDLSKYQQASPFMRRLASADVSIGTVQDENNDRRIGFALKLNVIKQRDPLMARELYVDIGEKYREERNNLDSQLRVLRYQLDTTKSILEKPALRSAIQTTEEGLLTLNGRRMAEINERAKIFLEEHWNPSSLDLSFGRLYAYRTDSTGSLKNLRLNRNTGTGAWLNGSIGLGKRWLLSGLLRQLWYEEELDFTLRSKSTGDELQQKAVASNRIYTAGLNLRYGGPIYTFFIEALYERKAQTSAAAALDRSFDAPDDFEVIGSTVKWEPLHPNSISFGGDWRISRAVVLNYGMRCVFTSNGRLQSFTPIATISCMMR